MSVSLNEFLNKIKKDLKNIVLPVPIGVDEQGNYIFEDLRKLWHVLIAGSTGSGKSTLIHTWICTLLTRTTPKDLRLLLIDPKQVDLTVYKGIPHLLEPVIVDMNRALSSFSKLNMEMERRFELFRKAQVKNIEAYNLANKRDSLPYIVVIVDEFCSLIAHSPNTIEDNVTKLAQMGRAVGIHMILSTSRPNNKVYTELIMGNFFTHIAFTLSTKKDSRWVVGYEGAETLLGKGDMLYKPPKISHPPRIQGVFISDDDISQYLQTQRKEEK